MSFYVNKSSYILHDYLKKASYKKRPIRKMTNDEWLIEDQLRQTKKKANLCITEMLLVTRIIYRMNVRDLYWVSNNFQRMVTSLRKQRDLVAATSAAFMGFKPNDEEMNAIAKLVPDIEKRIQFIHSVPIPENIELTPLKEYIDLLGSENFTDELKKEFPTGFDMFNAKNERLDAYIEKIFQTLEESGKANDYRKRLERYVAMAKEKKDKHDKEKKDEKLARATNESQNGIDLFMELFFKGVRTLEGCEKIGLGKQSIRNAINRGHRGDFIILCCGFGNQRLYYKYLRKDGQLTQYFGGAGFYKTMGEAEEQLRTATDQYPGKSFAVVAV